MTKEIAISNSIGLPITAVTQTLACIGRKGAGKTYLAGVIAEQMLDAGAQIGIIDPVGNWWGLRLGADGKSKGKEIFIAGGEHGDVPILPDSGARFAHLVVEKNISIILDVSSFRQGERKRFAAEFAEEFFHLKKSQRSAVHLFVEEAQLFAPQRPGPDEARMLGAFENIIRLGRNYGIGATLITQRPQSVNKEVLSQVECLCVLQVNGTHERKALDEWVQEKGADRKLIGELPGLEQGEGYVWSPAWLRIFKRVHFAKKATFNASATPEVGRTMKAGKLSPMDVEALKSDLKQVIESAEKDDPKALRKRIAELEAELKRKPSVDQSAIDALNQQLDSKDSWARSCARAADSRAYAMTDVAAKLEEIALDLRIGAGQEKLENQMPAKPAPLVTPKLKPQSEWPKPRLVHKVDGLDGPSTRVVTALAELAAVGIVPAPREQVAVFAGYTNLNSKGLVNALGGLRTAGLIDYPSPGTVMLTEDGVHIAPDTVKPKSEAEFHARLKGMMGGPEARLLDVLIERRSRPIDREDLAAQAGYTNLNSKGFVNSIGRLRTLGLLDYPQRGQVQATDLLFFNGSAA